MMTFSKSKKKNEAKIELELYTEKILLCFITL